MDALPLMPPPIHAPLHNVHPDSPILNTGRHLFNPNQPYLPTNQKIPKKKYQKKKPLLTKRNTARRLPRLPPRLPNRLPDLPLANPNIRPPPPPVPSRQNRRPPAMPHRNRHALARAPGCLARRWPGPQPHQSRRSAQVGLPSGRRREVCVCGKRRLWCCWCAGGWDVGCGVYGHWRAGLVA